MDLDSDRDTLTTALLEEEGAKKEDTNEVEAEPVPVPPPSAPSDDAELLSSELVERGEKQPNSCRDLPFAIVFYIQFLALAGLAVKYAPSMILPKNNRKSIIAIEELALPVAISAISTIILVFLSLIVLTHSGKSVITCSLWFSVVLSLAVGTLNLVSGQIMAAIFCFLSAAFGTCYAIQVRRRIPFASANLSAGVSAIQANGGILILSLLSGVFMMLWTFGVWFISLVYVSDVSQVCDDEYQDGECTLRANHQGFIYLWVLLLYWTQQVTNNVLHTTVAGTTSTWFFDPVNAQGFCSRAIWDSLFRAETTSFGSICLGSLLVALVQTLRFIAKMARSQNRENRGSGEGDALIACIMACIFCCIDCILGLLQDAMEYFNKWAFIYVGIYGYPFFQAGKKVMTLFNQRGWTVVINDHLIRNALALVSITIALLCGIISSLISPSSEITDGVGVFFIAFIVSIILSMTMLCVIESSVSTIIVCFAEAPDEFAENHPTHNQEMRDAWSDVYQIRF